MDSLEIDNISNHRTTRSLSAASLSSGVLLDEASEKILQQDLQLAANSDDEASSDGGENSSSNDDEDALTPPSGVIHLSASTNVAATAESNVSPLAANQQQAELEGGGSRRNSLMNLLCPAAQSPSGSRRESEKSSVASSRTTSVAASESHPNALLLSPRYGASPRTSSPSPAVLEARLNELKVENDTQSITQDSQFSQPEKYYREPNKRVFVNRSLKMKSIKFYGFDMDYTLALYKTPDFEQMGFESVLERLIQIGYPEELKGFKYDPSFPIRGLWFDTLYGTLLKCDQFGHIMVCVHGFQFLKPAEIEQLYPNKFIVRDTGSRLYIMNTIYNLPEIYLLACIVDYFVRLPGAVRTGNGVKNGSALYTYQSIFQDVRDAIDYVHMMGDLKEKTLSNLSKFVVQDERLPVLLDRIRESGAKTFLLTNSEYDYTEKIMTFLFDIPNVPAGRGGWKSYFDAIVVDAKKPLFFGAGTLLREVDLETGKLRLGQHQGPIERERVYSGGSCDSFTKMLGAKGKDVLYIGDHIFGDILKSKKTRGWRTFLIIPELAHELSVWVEHHNVFYTLERLDTQLTNIYKNLDSSSTDVPDIRNIRKAMRESIHHMDMSYGKLGSLFRSGSRQTFFAAQVSRYADLYASSCVNLLSYPFCYMFRAPAQLLPHESTVGHHPANATGVNTPSSAAGSNTSLAVFGQARRNHAVVSDGDDWYLKHISNQQQKQQASAPQQPTKIASLPPLKKTFPDVPKTFTQAADEYSDDEEEEHDEQQYKNGSKTPLASTRSSAAFVLPGQSSRIENDGVNDDVLLTANGAQGSDSPSAAFLVQQSNTDAFLHTKA